mmetsp:Transcript_28136/g.94774  ORF Transcript_28136/g.94774 Transcript_28136/m.94774 type:complete len:234 (+) Transcript_28136:1017-1718(+)
MRLRRRRCRRVAPKCTRRTNFQPKSPRGLAARPLSAKARARQRTASRRRRSTGRRRLTVRRRHRGATSSHPDTAPPPPSRAPRARASCARGAPWSRRARRGRCFAFVERGGLRPRLHRRLRRKLRRLYETRPERARRRLRPKRRRRWPASTNRECAGKPRLQRPASPRRFASAPARHSGLRPTAPRRGTPALTSRRGTWTGRRRREGTPCRGSGPRGRRLGRLFPGYARHRLQ